MLQVWVKTVGGSDDKAITADRKRGIRQYFWAHDNQTLLYLQDADGDENWHLYGVDLPTGTVRDYTPFQGIRAQVTYVLYPDEGHGFARPENRIDFNARAEVFLAQHLGGRAERMERDTYPGSSAIVKVVGD